MSKSEYDSDSEKKYEEKEDDIEEDDLVDDDEDEEIVANDEDEIESLAEEEDWLIQVFWFFILLPILILSSPNGKYVIHCIKKHYICKIASYGYGCYLMNIFQMHDPAYDFGLN